jgi:hypothetical protein
LKVILGGLKVLETNWTEKRGGSEETPVKLRLHLHLQAEYWRFHLQL